MMALDGGGGSAGTVDLPAVVTVVFSLLADVEQLPRWAPELFHRIEIGRDGWLAYTPLGELKLELTAEPRTGSVKLHVRFGREATAVFLFWMQSRQRGSRLRIIALDGKSEWSAEPGVREFYAMLLAATAGLRPILGSAGWQPIGPRSHCYDVAA